ncbi:MAG: amidohydrolase [Clostridia bacterium]|nr:amidohydrolase [Clostridia bacterium]
MNNLYADYILKSNSIYTTETEPIINGYIAIKENRVLHVGQDDENLDQYLGKNTEVLDHQNEMVMPGLIDSHVHLFFTGLQLSTINLLKTSSEEEAVKKVYDAYRLHNKYQWVIGFGWSQYNWKPANLPNKKTLDQWFPNTPVCLFNDEMHAMWVNSKALEICNITKKSENPPYGEIKRDDSGEPTGVLIETAMDLVMKHAIGSIGDKKEIIRTFLRDAAKNGITAVGDIQIYGVTNYEEYKSLYLEDELTCRIFFTLPLEHYQEYEDIRNEYKGDMLSFSGLKEFLDGTPGGHTGLMLEPYSDRPNHKGSMRIDEDVLGNLVRNADKKGYRIRFHACGDGAVRLGLDLYEEAQTLNGRRDSRHTIEHIECIHEKDLERFYQLGVLASVQPEHLAAFRFSEHPFHHILGEERCQLAWPFKSLINNRANISFGTDCPIVELNPFQSIYRSITRLHDDKKPIGGWIPKEKVSLTEAINAYTKGSAYLNFMEDRIGTIEAGKLADIIVIDRNLFEIDVEEILGTQVIMTMVNGKIVYQAMAEEV